MCAMLASVWSMEQPSVVGKISVGLVDFLGLPAQLACVTTELGLGVHLHVYLELAKKLKIC